MLIIQFSGKTCSTLYLTTPKQNIPEIYMQISTGNKHVFCSDEYMSPQIRIRSAIKTFLSSI